jgi:hypothetical protein
MRILYVHGWYIIQEVVSPLKAKPKPVPPVPPCRLFWAQMALAGLVPFKGPKKSQFLGPPPPKTPRVMDSPPSKPLRTAPYKQQVH